MNEPTVSTREIAIALVCSILFVGLLTFPLIIRPDITMLSGKYQWSHAWVMELLHQGLIGNEGIQLKMAPWSWNLREVIDGAGQFTTKTRLIDYPRGGRIVLLGWPYLLLGHVLRLLGLPILSAFNLSFMAGLSTAPFFAYILSRQFKLSNLGAAFSAAIFAASPYILGILYNGQVAKTSHGFIAALACCAVGLGRGQWGWAFLLVPLIPATFGASPYYFIFSIPLCAILFIWCFMATHSNKRRLKGALSAGVAVTISLYGCFPLMYHFQGRIKSLLAPATGGQNAEWFGVSSTPLSFIWPTELATGSGEFIPGEHHLAYLGIGVLVLAVFGLWRNHKGNQLLWLFIALLYGALSLGSAVQQGSPIPLPFDVFSHLLPENSALIMRYRAIVICTLALGILCGKGLQRIQLEQSKKWTTAVILIVLGDLWLSPAAPLPTPTEFVHLPRVYVEIAEENGDFGLIEFPCDILGPESISPHYFALLNELNQKQLFYQVYHQKGLGMVDKANLSREAYQLPLLRKMQTISFEKSIPPMGSENTDSLGWLKSMGFRYLIVHDRYIPPENRETLHTYLESTLGDSVYDKKDAIWKYELAPKINDSQR